MLKLINCITLQYVPKHEVLFRIGETGTTFYVSLTGTCQLFIRNPEQKALRHLKIDLLNEVEEEKKQLTELNDEARTIKIIIKIRNKAAYIRDLQIQIENVVLKQS